MSQLTAWESYSRLPHTSQTQEGKLGTVTQEKIDDVTLKDAEFVQTTADVHQNARTLVCQLDKQLSYAPDKLDFANAHYVIIRTLRFKPGYAKDYFAVHKDIARILQTLDDVGLGREVQTRGQLVDVPGEPTSLGSEVLWGRGYNNGAIKFTWQPPARTGGDYVSIDHYQILRASDGTVIRDNIPSSWRSVTIDAFAGGQPVNYAIRAVNVIGGQAGYSTTTLFPGATPFTAPGQPANVDWSQPAENTVAFTWSAADSGGKDVTSYHYTLYRNGAQDGKTDNYLSAATLSLTVPVKSANEHISLKVWAANDVGPGAAAPTKEALPTYTPPPTESASTTRIGTSSTARRAL